MFLKTAVGLNHDFNRREFESGAVFQGLLKGLELNGLVRAAEGRDMARDRQRILSSEVLIHDGLIGRVEFKVTVINNAGHAMRIITGVLDRIGSFQQRLPIGRQCVFILYAR